MSKPIHIVAHPDERLMGGIKITSDSERIVRQLCRQSGLSARYLVSEIIKQGADLVEFIDSEARKDNP